MSRHPLVTDLAFDLPPARRDEAFEQQKLAHMRTLYGISDAEMPCYVFHENSFSKYKMQMAKLYDACESMAIGLGLSGEGFRRSKGYFCAHGNYLLKGEDFHRNLKHLYELIYFRLEKMRSGGLAKQVMLRTSVQFLELQIRMCPTGLFTSLNKLAQELDQVGTEVASLEQMRQSIVDELYDYHNAFYQISQNLESHSLLQLKKTAARIGFTLRDGAEADQFVDETAHLIPYSEADAALYAEQMNARYTPELIAQNLVAFYTERMLEYRKTAADEVAPAAGAAVEQKAEPAAAGGLVVVVEPHAPVAHVMPLAAPAVPAPVAPAPRHRKALSNPDYVAELQRILKPLFDTGVITSIHDVIEWNDMMTDAWVSSEFMARLPALMEEHVIRQGYTLSPELVYLNQFVENVRATLSDDAVEIHEETRVMLAQRCAELMTVNYMPYSIPDGDLMADGVALPCLHHTQRGEAARHIMLQMMQQYKPIERLAMNEDGGSFSMAPDPVVQRLNALVERYEQNAKITPDPERCAESYRQVQVQKQRELKYEAHQVVLRQQARLEQAKQKVACNLQAALKRWQVKQQYRNETRVVTRIQAATRGYFVRLHKGDWQVDRVRRVVDALVKPFKVTDDKSKSLAYQLAFENDSAGGDGSKRPLLATQSYPVDTPLSRLYFDLYIEMDYWQNYCVTEDNELHFLSSARWGLPPTTGYVVTGAEQGAPMSKIVRRVAANEISGEWYMPLINLRIIRDEYAEVIAKTWKPEWVTATNLKLLSQLSFLSSQPENFARCTWFMAGILSRLPSPILTQEMVECVDWWVSGRYEATSYISELFLHDLRREFIEGNYYLRQLRTLPEFLTCNGTMKKLGGATAYKPQMLALFARIKQAAFESEKVLYTSQLTDRSVSIIKYLLSLPKDVRERHVDKINRYIDMGGTASVIAIALYPQFSASRAGVGVAHAAGVFVAPAGAAVRIGVFARPPVRIIQPREQGIFDRAMGRYIDAVHKMIAVFKADGFRTIELGYYDTKMLAWSPPYKAENLNELYRLTSYMQYLAQSPRARSRLEGDVKYRRCAALFTRIDRACDKFRVITRILTVEDFTQMKQEAQQAFRSLDLDGAADVPVFAPWR